MELTPRDVERHVGPRAMRRVRWYEVDDPVVTGSTVSGRVAGFAVSASLSSPLTSRCSCLYRSACDHVAVLLAAWIATPERFRKEEVERIVLPEHPLELAAWLEEHDPGMLDVPVDELIEGGVRLPRSHPLWRAMGEPLGAALEALDEPTTADGVEVLAPLRKPLMDVIRHRARARRAQEQADAWRRSAPDDPVLRPLWEAAHDALEDKDLARPPGAFGSATLDAEREVLLLRPRTHLGPPLEATVADGMLERLGTYARVEIAGLVLDHVVGPMSPDVRDGVKAILATPTWERALRRLDQGLARSGPVDPEGTGWKLESEGGRVTRLTPVALEPYKRRSGYKTRKLGASAVSDLVDPRDRAAFAAQKARAPLAAVLEQLVDHPRVVADDGELVRVRRGLLEVSLSDGDPLRVAILLDGAPLDASLLPLLREGDGQAAVRVGSAVSVVDVGPVLQGLAEIVERFGDRFPRAARKGLVQRLGLLQAAVPLRLGPGLRGTRVEDPVRPVLVLVPLADGALRVALRVRPLPGGPLHKPGSGPAEVARVVDGERTFAERDLRLEGARVLQGVAGLPLPTLTDWDGTLDVPDEGLDLVRALRAREDLEIVWPAARVSVSADEATGGQLRVRAVQRHDWFGVDGTLDTPGNPVRLADLLEAVRASRRYVQVDEGAWRRISDGLRDALRPLAWLATDEAEPRLPPLAAARAALALERGDVRVELPDELVDLEARIRAADALQTSVPSGLTATLRPYQREGLGWLQRMATWSPGAVLADEMGLGKTLQALAFAMGRDGPTLVVAPASVNLNWVRECGRFAPDLRVALYRGAGRAALLRDPKGVLITSWDLLVRDVEALAAVRFGTVVLDEAQALKNPGTRRARAARALDAGFVLALTGTPVENQILELWSLMRVVSPGLLGARSQFGERFAGPTGEPGEVSQVVRPFVLRRTKVAVAPDLPEREETVDWVELSATERVLYERFRTAAVAALQGGREAERMQVLAALTRLRQVACAPRLVDPDASPGSAKLDRLVERVLAAKEAGERVLVFSQFTSLLDLAEQALGEQDVRLLRLDGSTSIAERQARVDRFQAGAADAFLISLKAGGTGLNLTAASTVILLDPWWNPAAEDQASDRAHRIGQVRRVQIVRLVAAGTVEEEVLALHGEKRQLAATVLEGTARTASMTSEDLLALLR